MATVHFNTKLFKIGSWTIAHLPKSASAKLPSRDILMIDGKINDFCFQAVLEPDGKGSHWLKLNKAMEKSTKVHAGDTVGITIEPTKEWLEPKLPMDFKNALSNSSEAHSLWKNITPHARWDWIRWIRSTKQPETRKRRIENACAMLKSGKRRPCCFNRNLCSETSVSNKGVLLEPT